MEKTKTYIARFSKPRLPVRRKAQNFFTQEKKGSFFSPVQTKLTVGPADDQYEKEADNVAEQVMRMPDNTMVDDTFTPVSISSLQTKCAECEKEEKEEEKKEEEHTIQREKIADLPAQRKCKHCEEEHTVQKKDDGTSSTDSAGGSVESTLQSSGKSMDTSTQSFMEQRFGYDFSDVQIHNDQKANESAADISALAYTHQNHIVFGEGQYQTDTNEGKQLLAHELTHVVQQSSDQVARKKIPSIQRARDPSFEIADLFSGRGDADQTNFIYFDIAEPDAAALSLQGSIDSDERSKITEIANTQPSTLHLFGFASEEGSRSDNDALVARRMESVRLALIDDNFPAASIFTHNQRSTSRDHFDYRFWRVVEISENPSSTRVVPPSAARSRGIVTCQTDRTNTAADARQDALDMLDTVITRLTNYVQNPSADTDAQAALDFYFYDHTPNFVRNRLLRRYRRIRSFVQRMMRILKCGTTLSQDCAGADAITDPSEITLCDGFFTSGYDTRTQAFIIIHEAGHGSSEAIGDRAYRHERVFRFLNTSQALANAESLMILVEELISGSRPTDIVSPDLDTMNNCDSNPTLRDHIREAIAWAQRHNTYAMFGLQQTYGNDENTTAMSPFIIGQFGRADRTALAGILDRYTRMDEIFGQELTINCLDITDPQCTTSTLPIWTLAGEVSVCEQHLNQTGMQQRIDHMYAGLAAVLPGVTQAQQFSYPRLARIYKNEFWQERG